MAGITGQGTTFNLPNFTGELFASTPADTPFLSAIGGLSGGKAVTSTEFEWEGYDLRGADQRTKVEGATAPTAESRVRFNVTNVCQVHQEAIAVSYTKQAATGLKAGSNNDQANPVTSELDWQTQQMLKQVARDVEWSYVNGHYAKPNTNAAPRQTRGLLEAIATNVQVVASATVTTGFTMQAAGDTVTKTSHGLANDTVITLSAVTGATTVVSNKQYYVISTAANTFQLANSKGGTAIDIDVDGTASVITNTSSTDLTTDNVSALLQAVFDNGGIQEGETATLMSNSFQKRQLTKAFLTGSNNYVIQSRNVGGVNLQTMETDFGTLNLMLNRHMPVSELAVVSLEQCMPVFLEVPGKGHMFVEPLSKTGASDNYQLYGEVGLEYGNEKCHGKLVGLRVA
jgi:hypothetical protein